MVQSRETSTDFCDIGCCCFLSMKVFLFGAIFLYHRHSTLISQGIEDLKKLEGLPWLYWLLTFVGFFTILSYFTASATVLSGYFFTCSRFLPCTPSLHFGGFFAQMRERPPRPGSSSMSPLIKHCLFGCQMVLKY